MLASPCYHRRVRTLLFVPVALGLLICLPSARAQDLGEEQGLISEEQATERARTLFAEAIELADADDWARAVHRFRSALEYHDAPTIRFNLASSLSHLDRLLEALEELDRVTADSTADAALQAAAEQLRSQIEPRVGWVFVAVDGNVPDARVTMDGQAWDHAGELARVDPGIRNVRLLRGTEELAHAEIDVPDGGEARVTLRPAISPAAVAANAERDGDAQAPAIATASDEDLGLIIGLSVGGAVLLIGVAVLVGALMTSQSEPMYSMGDFNPPLIRVD